MDISEKLSILTGAAKYDVACTSSGVSRSGKAGSIGSAEACGICHAFASDGRCISLLKVLMTNYCVYDCQYCVNRRSNDVPRAAFSPEELAELAINFYRRNYIEGVFLSSAVIKSPDYTMEMLHKTLKLLRERYAFNGYIHVKAIPGAAKEMIYAAGLLADRMSVNIELPSSRSLSLLAPDKSKESILMPMRMLKDNITQSRNELTLYKNAPKFAPAGQSTQVIVGATDEGDGKIIRLAEGLYNKYSLKRVFYSAFIPVPTKNKLLPTDRSPLLREHRLYQADWLLRFYGFKSGELLKDDGQNLSLAMDPKCRWALDHIEQFPIEINSADYYTLLRVPGIGTTSAKRITAARRAGFLGFDHLKKMGIVLKRAKYFITCGGKLYERSSLSPTYLEAKLTESHIGAMYDQVNLFERNRPMLEQKEQAGGVKCLTTGVLA